MAQLPAKNLGLVVDGARLRDAIDILLEDGGFLQKHWLLKVIDHLPREPNWNRIREQGNGALEEIINIAKQDKQAALDLIEEVSSFTNHVVRPTLRGNSTNTNAVFSSLLKTIKNTKTVCETLFSRASLSWGTALIKKNASSTYINSKTNGSWVLESACAPR